MGDLKQQIRSGTANQWTENPDAAINGAVVETACVLGNLDDRTGNEGSGVSSGRLHFSGDGEPSQARAMHCGAVCNRKGLYGGAAVRIDRVSSGFDQ